MDSETDSDEERELLRGMTAKEKKYPRQEEAGIKGAGEERAVAGQGVGREARQGHDLAGGRRGGGHGRAAGRRLRLCLEVPPARAGRAVDAWRSANVHVRASARRPSRTRGRGGLPPPFWRGRDERPRLGFVDGASEARPSPKNLELKLPMRDFGGDRDSVDAGFHGLLLEARYWKGARSPQELVEYMHRLPPADRLQQGMVGWWTFEEGEGRYAFDRSELRYRSRIQGGWREPAPEKRVAGAPPFGDAGAPPPASREAGVCPVELRLVRLAEKARRALELIPCERCGAEVLTHGMRAHVRNHCVFGRCPATCAASWWSSRTGCGRRPAEGEEADCPVVAQRDALAARHAGGDVVTGAAWAAGPACRSATARGTRRSGAGCGRRPARTRAAAPSWPLNGCGTTSRTSARTRTSSPGGA